MSFELVMPRAGLTMVEGSIVQWKVAEGAQIQKGEPVLEIENEKTTMEVESTDSGFLHIVAPVGAVIPVGERIGIIAENKEEYDQILADGAASAPAVEAKKETSEPKAATTNQVSSTPIGLGGRARATGLAKKIAKEAGLDIRLVAGTGPSGRIVAKDVEKHLASGAAATQVVGLPLGEPEVIPWIGVRRTIANTMHQSLQSMAQTTATVEVDATRILEMRQNLLAKEDFLGCKITMNDLLSMVVIKTALKHPLANATFDGNAVTTYPYVNLSVAVGAEHGLMVPVVKAADRLSLTQISHAIRDFAERAKEDRLVDGEQSQGTSPSPM